VVPEYLQIMLEGSNQRVTLFSVQLVLQRRASRARTTGMGGRRDPRLQEDVHPHPDVHARAPHGKIHSRRSEQVREFSKRHFLKQSVVTG